MAAQLLLESVRGFFHVQENFDVLHSLRNRGRTDRELPSLRVIDYLVTRFAREHGITYDVPGSDIPMHLYLAHRAELDRYGKAHIDPFARVDKHVRGQELFTSPDGDGREVLASAKQLNFIRWAIRNRVIEYATAYLHEIRACLPAAGKKQKSRAGDHGGPKSKKDGTAKPSNAVCNDARVHRGDFRVSFQFEPLCSDGASK